MKLVPDIVRARVMAPGDLDREHVKVWDGFLDQSSFRSPFLSAAWSKIVANHRNSARVALISDADGVVGFLPYEISGALLRAAHRIGGELSDCCGVVGAPRLRLTPPSLLEAVGVAHFMFDHLPDTQCEYGLPSGAPQWGLRIDIGEDDSYWRRMAKHNRPFVNKLASGERQLVRDLGPLRFTLHSMDIDSELENLIEHKRIQYMQSQHVDLLRHDWTRGIISSAAKSNDDRCAGVLSTLYAGDQWVASSLGLRCLNVLHEWFPVYNQALRRYSPGHLLRRHIIQNAGTLGIQILDFGEGRNPHKAKYIVKPYTMSKGRWIVPGLPAFAAIAIQSAVWRASKLRRYLG